MATQKKGQRALLLVLDGVGIGALPDAAAFGDQEADTIGHIAQKMNGLELPNLAGLGLGHLHSPNGPILGVEAVAKPKGCYGIMAEQSAGKDSTAGHWELAGLITKEPFGLFPQGFPEDLIERFCQKIGIHGVLGNKAASGTGIIDELGAKHVESGRPIVYTSADPVLQIAAHEEVMPIKRLYEICQIAFDLVQPLRVARVIARPFVGKPGAFVRTARRRDFSVAPPSKTVLDELQSSGIPVYGVGKVDNLFAGQGFSACLHTPDNMAGVDVMLQQLQESKGNNALIFANLIDFDQLYGHRRDSAGFAKALEAFDQRLPEILSAIGNNDLLIITADHGNDPEHRGSDHTREQVPLLATTGRLLKEESGKPLGLRDSFADVAATLAMHFELTWKGAGKSFCDTLI